MKAELPVLRHHPMPFGAEFRERGAVCFSLWAPSARRVEVVLGDGVLPFAPDGSYGKLLFVSQSEVFCISCRKRFSMPLLLKPLLTAISTLSSV
jgi:hypothetical protein